MKTETKFDIYETLTAEIVAMMDKGVCPWRQPWKAIGGIPMNYRGSEYRGANAMILAMTCFVESWDKPIFLTFKQVQECGGTVIKGSKSTMVMFATQIVPEKYKGREKDCPANEKKFLMRYYRVFNIAQTENVKLPKWDKSDSLVENDPIATCELILENMPQKPLIKHGGNEAFYSPKKDFVQMPARKHFVNSEAYYATLFHELSHATGHESRLARKDFETQVKFGSDPYAFEELVAELSACFVCGYAGIVDSTKENTAGYIQSWLKVFKGDNKFFFRAASLAQKSADFILAKNFEKSED